PCPPPLPLRELEEPVPRAEHRNRTARPGPEDRRVAVARLQVVQVPPELPTQMAGLRLPEQLRLAVAQEPGQPRAAPPRRAEVDRTGLLLLHLERDVHVPGLGRLDLRHRQRRLEEPERHDALVAL